MHKEVCGVLVGSLCWDKGPYLKIDGRIEGRYAGHQSGSVTFTSDTWTYINEVLEKDYQGKRIVGWYHTHPGFGIFLSGMDTFIHDNFFDLPWQPAYVYDPHADSEGFFFKVDGKLQQEPVSVFEDEMPIHVEVHEEGDYGEEENGRSSVWRRLQPIGIGFLVVLLAFTALFGVLRMLSTDHEKEALESELLREKEAHAVAVQTVEQLRAESRGHVARAEVLQSEIKKLEESGHVHEKTIEVLRADKERLAREREQAISERDAANKSWHGAVCEKEQAQAERDQARRERDAARKDWNAVLEGRNAARKDLEKRDGRAVTQPLEPSASTRAKPENKRSFWKKLLPWNWF